MSEELVHAGKGQMPFAILAVQIDHLVGGTLFIAPVAALGEQLNAAVHHLGVWIVIVRHFIHADRRASIGVANEHLQDVAVRLRVEREILARLPGFHADDLAEMVYFDDELGVQRHGWIRKRNRLRVRRRRGVRRNVGRPEAACHKGEE